MKFMTDISNKDSEQDVKIAVLDSTLENATRRMELIHKRIDRTEERVTKLNEDVRERIRALEKWVWGCRCCTDCLHCYRWSSR